MNNTTSTNQPLVPAQAGCSENALRKEGNHRLNLNKNNWTHYLYTIRFEDGSYYVGVSRRKGDDPRDDGYYGSPKTNADKWREPHVKEVNALLFCEHEDEPYLLECEFQKLVCDLHSPLCLNARVGGYFPLSVLREVGEKNGKTNVEQKRGWWSDDPAYLERVRAARSRGGRGNVESGVLARARVASREATRKEVWLKHRETGEVLHLLAVQDAKRHNLSPSKVCMVRSGKRTHHKGWELLR